jgi:hypothetical protein
LPPLNCSASQAPPGRGPITPSRPVAPHGDRTIGWIRVVSIVCG